MYFIGKVSGNSMAHMQMKSETERLPNCVSLHTFTSFGLHFYYEACKNLYAVSLLLAYFEQE